MRRRLGAPDWQRPGPALERQTDALLSLFDELRVRATFFVLGLAARSHPELVRAIAAAGHEIACHGDQHLPVRAMTPAQLTEDLRSARTTIEALAERAPIGYRAPAFSLTASSRWAYEVLAQEGFRYDSSQHDSPRIRGRIHSDSSQPHPLALESGAALWEFPLAVWRPAGARIPVGGASYWALMPRALLLGGLARAGDMAGLYLHPHELDPRPLRVGLSRDRPARERLRARARELQRNSARWRAPELVRAIAGEHRLIPYGEAYAELSAGAGRGAGAPPLPREGQAVR